MMDWSTDEDPYEVLGITFEISQGDLKKRYRRLVLEKHPDKQPGNKQAADEFIKIQRAYEILTDDKAKAAFDALRRAKEAREAKLAGHTDKRRKMAADLEKREREYEVEKQQEKAARNKLNAELARLRKEMANKEAERQAAQLRERVAASLSGAATSSQQEAEEASRTLKVSWDATMGSYTEEQLRGIFAQHGAVEDIIVRQPKKRGKGSALIVMRSLQAAVAAADAVSGELENPLLVVPLAKTASVGQPPVAQPGLFGNAYPSVAVSPSAYPDKGPGRNGSSSLFPGVAVPPATGKPLFSSFPGSAGGSTPVSNGAAAGASHANYESDILAKMRRKAEADRNAQQRAQEQ